VRIIYERDAILLRKGDARRESVKIRRDDQIEAADAPRCLQKNGVDADEVDAELPDIGKVRIRRVLLIDGPRKRPCRKLRRKEELSYRIDAHRVSVAGLVIGGSKVPSDTLPVEANSRPQLRKTLQGWRMSADLERVETDFAYLEFGRHESFREPVNSRIELGIMRNEKQSSSCFNFPSLVSCR
jgi:hypothetical protein